MEKKLNNKMKNNFFYSESGLSASMLFNKLGRVFTRIMKES